MQHSQQQPSINFSQQTINQDTKIYSIIDYSKQIWDLGIITYGGPMSHVGIFRQRFVDTMHCINNEQFLQLLMICQSIPGPSSTQLLMSVSMYATQSFIGGLIAFILFSFPTFLIMLIAGIFITKLQNSWILTYIFPGLRVVAISIIFQAFTKFFDKIKTQLVMVCIVIITTIVYYIKNQTIVILILFVISGIVGLMFNKIGTSNNKEINQRFNSWVYGIKNIVIYGGILGIVIIVLPEVSNVMVILFCEFYKIGSLVIGGGHVILPIMQSEFQPYKLITKEEFYNGFSLISVMPGPMFNLCVYVGAIITKNVWGAIFAFIGLYLPCFLFVLFVLPFWQNYRKLTRIKAIINGICASSIGLILSTAFILFKQAIHLYKQNYLWYLLLSVNCILCYWLIYKNWIIIAVFFVGDLIYVGSIFLVGREEGKIMGI